METRVSNILIESDRVQGIRLKIGEIVKEKMVVSAPGRVGAGWMQTEANRIHLATIPSPVDIGGRVELAAAVLQACHHATPSTGLKTAMIFWENVSKKA